MFLYIPTTLVATLRCKAVSRDQVDQSWQVLGNIEFGWKKAGKVTLKVCGWARWEDGGSGELSVKAHEVQSVSLHSLQQTFLWKVKGKDGKASSRIT